MPSLGTDITDQQVLFVKEYIKDYNAVAAYYRAGYKAKNKRCAEAAVCRLIAQERIQNEITKQQAFASAYIGITASKVLGELASIGFGNIANVTNWDAEEQQLRLKSSEDISPFVLSSISEITQTGTGSNARLTIKTHDKIAALKILCKYLGLDSDLNAAINTLRRYGLVLYKNQSDEWELDDRKTELDTILYDPIEAAEKQAQIQAIKDANYLMGYAENAN